MTDIESTIKKEMTDIESTIKKEIFTDLDKQEIIDDAYLEIVILKDEIKYLKKLVNDYQSGLDEIVRICKNKGDLDEIISICKSRLGKIAMQNI